MPVYSSSLPHNISTGIKYKGFEGRPTITSNPLSQNLETLLDGSTFPEVSNIPTTKAISQSLDFLPTNHNLMDQTVACTKLLSKIQS
jgi:hypothetical protein